LSITPDKITIKMSIPIDIFKNHLIFRTISKRNNSRQKKMRPSQNKIWDGLSFYAFPRFFELAFCFDWIPIRESE
jgi:hypothetical protein